jgi:hypothetical protein
MKTNRGNMPETAEILTTAINLRKASEKYSVNFMMLQRCYKRLEEGSSSNFYIKQFYN